MILNLEPIKARLNNAAHGPWKVVKSEESGTQIGTIWEHGQLKSCLPIVTTAHGVGKVTVYISDNNAEFIANAPTDIATLVDTVEKHQTLINKIKAVCDQSNNSDGAYIKRLIEEMEGGTS